MEGDHRHFGLGELAFRAATGRAGVFVHDEADAVDARVGLQAGPCHGALRFTAEVGAAVDAAKGSVGRTGVTAVTGLHAESLDVADGIVAGS